MRKLLTLLFILSFTIACEQTVKMTSPDGEDDNNNEGNTQGPCRVVIGECWSNFSSCSAPSFNVGFDISGLDNLSFSYQYVYMDICYLKDGGYYNARLTANQNVNLGMWSSDSSSVVILDSSPLIDDFPSHVQFQLTNRDCDSGNVRHDDEHITFIYYIADGQPVHELLFSF